MLKGHLPRVIYHQVYQYTKEKRGKVEKQRSWPPARREIEKIMPVVSTCEKFSTKCFSKVDINGSNFSTSRFPATNFSAQLILASVSSCFSNFPTAFRSFCKTIPKPKIQDPKPQTQMIRTGGYKGHGWVEFADAQLVELPALTTRPRGIDGSVWPRKTAILEMPRREGS